MKNRGFVYLNAVFVMVIFFIIINMTISYNNKYIELFEAKEDVIQCEYIAESVFNIILTDKYKEDLHSGIVDLEEIRDIYLPEVDELKVNVDNEKIKVTVKYNNIKNSFSYYIPWFIYWLIVIL